MKLVLIGSENKIEILKCTIQGDSTKEIAHITTNIEQLQFGDYEIFSGTKKIFTGKLVSVLDQNQCILESVSEIRQKGVLGNLLKELECQRFVRSGSGKVLAVDAKDFFSISIKKNQPTLFRVQLNLVWKSWKAESWDVGSEVFSSLTTITPDSILKSFPSINSTVKDWVVTESEITEKSKKWLKINDKYREVTEFKGSLVLNRIAEVFNYETWLIGSEGEPLNLFVDLTNYTCPYSEWKPNTKYTQGTLVLYGDLLKKAKLDHISSVVFAGLYWEDEANYYACDKESLLYSGFGRDLLTALNDNVYDFILKTYPLIVLDFVGTWESWKALEIGTLLEIKTKSESIKVEVTKFIKKMNCNLEKSKREVLVQCRKIGDSWNNQREPQVSHKAININVFNGVVTRDVSVLNPAAQQLQEENVQASSIALSMNPFYTNQIKVQLR